MYIPTEVFKHENLLVKPKGLTKRELFEYNVQVFEEIISTYLKYNRELAKDIEVGEMIRTLIRDEAERIADDKIYLHEASKHD